MRSYLVVMDETEEALAALRYAARRAARTGGGVEMLALIEQPEFVQWGAVQEAMEEEARLRAEAMLVQASGAIMEEAGIKPSITVRQGDPVKAVARVARGARRYRRARARRRGGRRARAADQPFRRRRGGDAALPADHRPRRAQRRSAGAALT